jgi:Family of unknown function (DUF6152)
MKAICSVLAALAVALAQLPASAHHSFAAQYDAKKPVTLKGKVTKVEWTNPHARFYVDVKDPNGRVTNWNMELGSPNGLRRAGWTRTTLSMGDEVAVTASLARDGSRMANAREVTLAGGKKIFTASSATQ